MSEPFRIIEGATYIYIADCPAACKGHHYRVLKCDLLVVPAYSRMVLVEALTGPDEGLWFCCPPANFATRYVPVDVPPAPPMTVDEDDEQPIPPPVVMEGDKVAGYHSTEGSKNVG